MWNTISTLTETETGSPFGRSGSNFRVSAVPMARLSNP
jgi:hypothetical protein